MTRLKFVNGVLGGSWETLTQGRADIIVGAMRAPPPDTGFGFARLGDLELVFAVAPHHPLVHEEEPLSRQTIKRFRAIVVGDSVHSSRSIGSELLDAQEAITVFDFKPSWSCKLVAWDAAIYRVIWRSDFWKAARL